MNVKDALLNFFQQRFRKIPGTSSANPNRDFLNFVGGDNTEAGVRIDEWSALNNSVVFACVRILSETLASVPCHVYERHDRGKNRASDHPLYFILHSQFNPEVSAFSGFETMQGHLSTWGNAYAEIEWSKDGQVKNLWLLRPDRTYPERSNGKIVYRTIINSKGFVLPKHRVFHVAALGFDGLVGYSPIDLARQSIGLSAGAEKYGSKFFANNARPGGYLRHPGKLSESAQERMVKSWESRHSGLDNVNRLAVLEEGMEFQTVGIPPQDAQMLQTRKFQVAEIARWYRMPLHKIQEMENSTYSNIEQQAIEFLQDTMLPWFRRWESAIKTQLLSPLERQQYFAEFLMESLLRGDTKARYEAYSVARQWGWMSANDIREKENDNLLPDEQGNIYLVPMNMVPASHLVGGLAEDMTRNIPQAIEQRSKQSGAVQRMKLAATFERIFADAGLRIVRREKRDVLRQAKKLLQRSVDDFGVWLDEFYREAPEWMIQMFIPVLFSLSEAIQAQAAMEVNAEAGMSPELEKWMQGYAEIWARNYAASSLGQLKNVIKTALEESEDVYEAIETRLDEWEKRRPGKLAKKETVEASNVVTKFVWAAAGITTIRWVNTGSDTCPYCEELHGCIVGIDQPFVDKNDQLASDDGVMRIRQPVFTPPLHAGCVCQLEYIRR